MKTVEEMADWEEEEEEKARKRFLFKFGSAGTVFFSLSSSLTHTVLEYRLTRWENNEIMMDSRSAHLEVQEESMLWFVAMPCIILLLKVWTLKIEAMVLFGEMQSCELSVGFSLEKWWSILV